MVCLWQRNSTSPNPVTTMPSVTKMASFHSPTGSHRLKGHQYPTLAATPQHPPRVPQPQPHPTPATEPSLPDVHSKQQDAGPWSFLYTLLQHDQQEGGPHAPQRAARLQDTEEERGERRRLPRDSERRLSGSLAPEWKRTKHGHRRLNRSYDWRPAALTERQLRRYTSPLAAGGAPDPGRGAVTDRGASPGWQRVEGRKWSSGTKAVTRPDDGDVGGDTAHDNPADNVTPSSDEVRAAGRVPLSTSPSPTSQPPHPGQAASARDPDDKMAALDSLHQWTTCRALREDSSEDSEGTDEDGAAPGNDEDEDEDEVVPREGAEGARSRATSSNPSRKKRPLLLPPIMLPPVYAAKPTPLKLRDEPLYYMGAQPRARRARQRRGVGQAVGLPLPAHQDHPQARSRPEWGQDQRGEEGMRWGQGIPVH